MKKEPIIVSNPQIKAKRGISTIGNNIPEITNDNGIEAAEMILTAAMIAGTSCSLSEV
jgi:alcohol dehydrogenase class IV